MEQKPHLDLEENDLLAFLQNFKSWWEKYGNYALTLVLVLLVGVLGYQFWQRRQMRLEEEKWRSLSHATTPQAFRDAAEAQSDVKFKAQAYLAGGDLALGRALEGGEGAKASLDQAEAMYLEVTKLKAPFLFKGNALLGLATVAEERLDFNKAEQFYKQIEREAPEREAFIKARATAQLEILEKLKTDGVPKLVEAPPSLPTGPPGTPSGTPDGITPLLPTTQPSDSSLPPLDLNLTPTPAPDTDADPETLPLPTP